MARQMMRSAQPLDLKRLGIVMVMRLRFLVAAFDRASIWLLDVSTTNINMQIGSRVGSLPGFWRGI